MSTNYRRKFIKNSAIGSTGYLMGAETIQQIFSKRKRISAIDKINVGLIGCNGMGMSNLTSMLKMNEIECIALCDVDANVLEKRSANVKELQKSAPKLYNDYRKLIADKSIDVVIIGTPDHWHCLPMVESVETGKHVYVEKPISNTIEECRVMVAAAKKYNKVVQVGQWQRSGTHYKEAIDIVRSGKLGNIRLVKVWAYQGWMKPIEKHSDSAPPEGVDYRMWLGPAPMRPFNQNRFHFNFRWFWDYAGGLMTDWGVHEIDIALYAMNALAPVSVMATGGKLAYPDDASETPDTLQTVFQYEGFNMLWEHATGIDFGPYGRREGIAFLGNNGTLVLNRDGYEILVEREAKGYSEWGTDKMERIDAVDRPKDVSYLDLHTANFINAVKANDSSLLNTPIESGSVAAINAQMGNIAYKTGQKLYWDKAKSMFVDNEAANSLMKAQYHNGWKLPKIT